MSVGKDWNKDRFKYWQLCVSESSRAIKLTQNCGCFTNPRINLFVPLCVTREYPPRCLNFGLLQCIAAYLQCALPWVFGEISYPIFIPTASHATENRSSACWKGCSEDASSTKSSAKSYPVTVDPATSNSDTLVDSAVTYLSYSVGYEEEWWQHIPLSESNTHGDWWWF